MPPPSTGNMECFISPVSTSPIFKQDLELKQSGEAKTRGLPCAKTRHSTYVHLHMSLPHRLNIARSALKRVEFTHLIVWALLVLSWLVRVCQSIRKREVDMTWLDVRRLVPNVSILFIDKLSLGKTLTKHVGVD